MKIIPLFCVIFMSACVPQLYYPTMQHVPAFEKKGQIAANCSGSIFGGDCQVGYAVTDKVGLLLNVGRYTSDEDTKGFFEDASNSANFLEIGAGYYFKKKKHLILETYGFIGIGKICNRNENLKNEQRFTSDLIRIAVQPTITYLRKNIEMSISVRYSYLNYYSLSNNLNISDYSNASSYLRAHPNYHFIEPAATLRVGFKNVKFQLQLQRSFVLNHPAENSSFGFIPAMGYIGCFVKF